MENKITLQLTVEQTNYILQALQELPAKIANPLAQLILQQANSPKKAEEPVERELS